MYPHQRIEQQRMMLNQQQQYYSNNPNPQGYSFVNLQQQQQQQPQQQYPSANYYIQQHHQQQQQQQQLSNFCPTAMPPMPQNWPKYDPTFPSTATSLDETVIANTELRGKLLKRCHVTKCTLINCIISDGCLLQTTALANCIATNVPLFLSCSMDSCSVTSSNLTYCFIRKIVVSNCRMLDCRLTACSVASGAAVRTSFGDCVMKGRVFEQFCNHHQSLVGGNVEDICRDAGAPSFVNNNNNNNNNNVVTTNENDASCHQNVVSDMAAVGVVAVGGPFQDNEDGNLVRARLEKFYVALNKQDQFGKIPMIMKTFKGREAALWATLKQKYGDVYVNFVSNNNNNNNDAKIEESNNEKNENSQAQLFQDQMDKLSVIRRRMLAIYKKHAPEKVINLETLLLRFRGHEESVIAALKIKYAVSDQDEAVLLSLLDVEEEQEKKKESEESQVTSVIVTANSADKKQEGNDGGNEDGSNMACVNEISSQSFVPLPIYINNPNADERKMLRLRCANILKIKLPQRNLDETLNKYLGREEFLLPALVKKYCSADDGDGEPALQFPPHELLPNEFAKEDNQKEGKKPELELHTSGQEKSEQVAEIPPQCNNMSSNTSVSEDLGSLDDLDLDEEDIFTKDNEKNQLPTVLSTNKKSQEVRDGKHQDDDDLDDLDLNVDDDDDLMDLDLDLEDEDDDVSLGSLDDMKLDDK